jgi:hypothetical protein
MLAFQTEAISALFLNTIFMFVIGSIRAHSLLFLFLARNSNSQDIFAENVYTLT